MSMRPMPAGSRRGTRRQTWVAFLRGINLGSHNKVSMAELRALFEDIGAEDVATYVQSGNAVFRSALARGDLVRKIEREIHARLGLEVTVVLRTKAELARLVAANPFAERESDPTKLHVTFLAAAPDRRRLAELDRAAFAPDDFHLGRNAVYLHMPKGYGRSKLSNAFFEKQLSVRATTRNWRTVTKLAELAS
jgi:uncharacterized protein (DUF1697 family)